MRSLTAALALAVIVIGSGAAAAAPPELQPGDTHFWDGEYVAQSRGGLPVLEEYFFAEPEAQPHVGPCVTGLAFCRRYEFEVTTAGATLRVAIDASRRGECFALELRDPDGRFSGVFEPGFPYVCPEEIGSPQIYTLEIEVPEAAAGTWELRALGFEVTDWAYRLRAVLQSPAAPKRGLLRPNLIPWLPSEFGFVAPASDEPGTAIDRRNPPGDPGVSCHAEEAPDSHCLRFSSGISNVGAGPLFIRFVDDRALQHVYRADDTPDFYFDNEENRDYVDHRAGTGEWHEPTSIATFRTWCCTSCSRLATAASRRSARAASTGGARSRSASSAGSICARTTTRVLPGRRERPLLRHGVHARARLG